ncbi:MAG: DUF5060 domain-containing protein [Bacteroidota bacterium]
MEICKLKLKSPVVLITLGMMVCLACSHVTRAQEIIPPERRTQWDPGIPGGIPEIAGPVENILDHGADPAGVHDSWQAIADALDALPPEGGVVFIPRGTYRVVSGISVGRDSVVFRGEGWDSKLLIEHPGNSIEVITYQRGTWQLLPEGAAKGSSAVTVEDGSAFTPGEFAEIEQENDSLLMYTDEQWIQPWSENAVGQIFRVKSVDGNQVTFESPVHLDFSNGLNARIRPQGLVSRVGFEDLYVEKTVADGSTFSFKNTAYCWVRNVESYHTRRSHVSLTSSLGNEIRDSYFHRSFDYGGGGSGYGVDCGTHVSNTLVENNIFDSLRHAMMVQVGASGNVFGYNYSIHPVQGEGETNLNEGWVPPDISIHGHYPFMNLFEGNRVQEIGIGDYWGPAGPGNTYFRNRVGGEGIFYYDASHGQNLIGNITTVLEDRDGMAEGKLEHGNVVGGSVQWDPGIPSHDLPDSYYLDSVPEFFGELDWPAYGPGLSSGNKLPAQVAFESFPYLRITHDPVPAEQYEKFEFTIDNGKTYENPFDPEQADIFGVFVSPLSDTMRINAFWDGIRWRLRFAGADTGQWTYRITVIDRDGRDERPGSFRVTGSGSRGWIGPSGTDPHYLAFDDGTPFYGVGMAVPWLVYDQRYYPQPQLLSLLASRGVNFINWLFTSWDILLLRDSYKYYSMEDASAFDRLIADAEQNGIKILLGIWIHDLLRDDPHPWGNYGWEHNPFNQLTTATGFFSDSVSWEYQKKYYRYIIARWGYSASVGMWHTVAEINGTSAIYDPLAMENDPRGWHNKINRYFMENDPFGHPTSVSGSGGFDFSEGWEVTQCPQVHEYPYPRNLLKENTDRIAYWSDVLSHRYNKPNLVGEFGKYLYEEGKSETFLHNGIWAGLMSGVCVTPLHWWGGQIASRPENFSTFTLKMMQQLQFLGKFTDSTDMAEHNFTSLYSAPEGHRITLSGMPEGKVYGLKGDSTGMCWVYHYSEYSTESFSGVGVSFPDLPEGRYRISFFDTWEGEWLEEAEAETAGGRLDFVCPEFTADLAVKMEYAGPGGLNASRSEPESEYKIFPNPSDNFVHLENLAGARSVRLITLSGQLLDAKSVDRRDRISIDVSPYGKGIYLLEVEGPNGSLETRKVVLL